MEPAKDPSLDRGRVREAYETQGPVQVRRLRAKGISREDAEDLVQDAFAGLVESLPLLPRILNLPAWIATVVQRRLADQWRRREVRQRAGETSVAHEVVHEVFAAAGLDPLDAHVRETMLGVLATAMGALPPEQRLVIEAQVFEGMSFRELSEKTGISADTLAARKRYALARLGQALEEWKS